ncbi:MAG: menaquinone-dependent protoporphyrinogen IX dehydrogenase [Geminicoccaceae bacterium]|nr:MAG: menaquinone-dependent protoporphyrinogen IX dehydrogenase [Geminicoccaceae bacterium]
MAQEQPARLYVASRDGQALRIGERIAQHCAEAGRPLTLQRLGDTPPPADEFAQAPLVGLVAAVRYGKHLAEAEAFLAVYRNLPTPPPLALASVNLTARKPGKDTGATNPYITKWIARQALSPVATAAFAGRLDYPRYRWFDRQIIRFIMLLTGGPTDGTSTVEYTSWPAVDAFAAELLTRLPADEATRAPT